MGRIKKSSFDFEHFVKKVIRSTREGNSPYVFYIKYKGFVLNARLSDKNQRLINLGGAVLVGKYTRSISIKDLTDDLEFVQGQEDKKLIEEKERNEVLTSSIRTMISKSGAAYILFSNSVGFVPRRSIEKPRMGGEDFKAVGKYKKPFDLMKMLNDMNDFIISGKKGVSL